MSVYIIVVLYVCVSVLLSKCTEARTLNSAHKTKTKSVVINITERDVSAKDENCENEVNIKKPPSINNMEAFISCDYFSETESCEPRLPRLLKKRLKF